jgi:hypothetical protein
VRRRYLGRILLLKKELALWVSGEKIQGCVKTMYYDHKQKCSAFLIPLYTPRGGLLNQQELGNLR